MIGLPWPMLATPRNHPSAVLSLRMALWVDYGPTANGQPPTTGSGFSLFGHAAPTTVNSYH